MTISSKDQSDIILLKDREWAIIDGELCRVSDFTPMFHMVKDGRVAPLGKETWMPFASITFECKKMAGRQITGYITHKMDFKHLWIAFKERKIGQDEEVLIIWTKKHYSNIFAKIFSAFMPKLWVMICPKGAYELRTDRSCRPELTGEARFLATRPIVDWKSEAMK